MKKLLFSIFYSCLFTFLSINYVQAIEAAKSHFYEGTSNHINYFEVALSTPLSIDATVTYQTQDGTALAGSDYIAKSGKVTITAGETSILISIEIIGDEIVEDDESFSLIITNPSGGVFPEGTTEMSVSHTILNDDIEVSFSETNSNHTNYFLLELNEALSIDASVSYQTQDGTAISGQDYISVEGTATIPAGDMKTLIAVPILGDNTEENNETFDLVLRNPIGGIFPAGIIEVIATHTILNDDFTPTPIDNTQAIARNLTKIMLSGIIPILTTQTLLDQPDDLANPIALNINNSSFTCPTSGTFEYTFTNDPTADTIQKYSEIGDNLAFTLSSCVNSTITSTGEYNLRITDVVGTVMSSDVTLTDLVVNDGLIETRFNGLLVTTETTPIDTSDNILVITSSNLQLISADTNYSFSNLSTQVATEQLSDDRKIQTYTSTLTLSNSSNNGTYSTAIIDSMNIHPADNYPYEGKFTIQRQDATMNITVTVNSNSQVTIEADTSGDNIADYTQTVAWSELSSGF